MNITYTPKNKLSLVEWFIKHRVSEKVCLPSIAIARALDHQINISEGL
jgi:hypothetical protein